MTASGVIESGEPSLIAIGGNALMLEGEQGSIAEQYENGRRRSPGRSSSWSRTGGGWS